MKRKILILICLILFIVSVAGVSAADDVNQTVNDDTLSVSDDIDVISANDDGTFTALQKKIDNAPEGSTINLENDYKYDNGFSGGGISIDKKLTIDGKGHSIDGAGMARIFDVSGDVILKNILFKNGNIDDEGGAIQFKGDFISCINCTFTGNRAGSGHGGAIYVGYERAISLSDCTFIDNRVTGVGGYKGGALFLHYSDAKINNCIFEDNYAESSGGAIYINYGNASIENSQFINNEAFNYGGAIYWMGTGMIDKCDFKHNMALKYGDGIYLNVRNNKIIKNCNFNSHNDEAIYFSIGYYNSEIFLSNLKFKDNQNDYDGLITVIDNVLIFGGIGDIYPSKNVVINIGGKTYYGYLDPIVSVNLNDLPSGVYDTKISYDNSMIITLPITIESSTNLEVPDVTKNYGGPERLQITLTESGSPIANADVNININGVDYTRTTDSNGKASMAINLNSGQYYATVTYKDVSTKALVTVNALNTETTLSYTKNSHNGVTLAALVSPATATGNVVFNVNGKDYTAKVTDGKATYQLSALAIGDYEAKATYNGDMNHKQSSSNTVKFTVEDVKVDVNAPDLTKYYKGPERFVVTVKEDGKAVVGKDVTINLNGATYTRTTNENGEASMAINLNSGEYKVTSEFEGIKVDSTITVKSTVSGENITKIFRNGTQYYATFIDTSGKTLAENTAVEFNINGVFYTRYTNDKGVARMNINLNPGEYIITAKNPNSTEQYTNIITVLPSIVENYNLTKYYRNASQYSLRLLDDQGNPVKAGVEITLNINGVFYKRMSNATGYVNMNINLEPGEYIITADYNGLMASNTIKVLSVIETKNLDMKYKDGSKFNATILDGQGKPYANQKVTFNINGVFYDRITNENGVASLAINLMAGEYIITTSYNGLNAANKVTISS